MVYRITKHLNCSSSKGNTAALCRFLPIGFPFDVAEIQRPDGHNVKLLFSSQSSDAIIYVTVIIAVYFVVFVAFLVYTLTKGSHIRSPRNRTITQRPRKQRPRSRRSRTRPRMSRTKLRTTAIVTVESDAGSTRSAMYKDEKNRFNPYDDQEMVFV